MTEHCEKCGCEIPENSKSNVCNSCKRRFWKNIEIAGKCCFGIVAIVVPLLTLGKIRFK